MYTRPSLSLTFLCYLFCCTNPRSVYFRSTFIRFLQNDSPPLRPRPGTRRGSSGLGHSRNAHNHHRASAVPPVRVHPCGPAMHPHPADYTTQSRSGALTASRGSHRCILGSFVSFSFLCTHTITSAYSAVLGCACGAGGAGWSRRVCYWGETGGARSVCI